MAEITSTNSNFKKGIVKRMVKKSTRVDLTPMVDLGFLLVTFFVFTTTMAQPKVMKINMPNDKSTDVNDEVCETCALTVLLDKNNKLYYYEGLDKNAVYKQTTYSHDGIRTLITEKKKRVSAANRDMVLIIKSSDQSTLKNLVNVIDESNIAMIKRYYMAELNEQDKRKLSVAGYE